MIYILHIAAFHILLYIVAFFFVISEWFVTLTCAERVCVGVYIYILHILYMYITALLHIFIYLDIFCLFSAGLLFSPIFICVFLQIPV